MLLLTVEALDPFDEATIEMSAEKVVSIAKVIPLVRGLKELTKAHYHTVLGQKLTEQLNRRFPRPEDSLHVTLAAATFLDPRSLQAS